MNSVSFSPGPISRRGIVSRPEFGPPFATDTKRRCANRPSPPNTDISTRVTVNGRAESFVTMKSLWSSRPPRVALR